MNTPKPYLIGAFNNGIEANRFFWSLDANLGDSVRPIMLMYLDDNGEYCKDLFMPSYVQLIKVNKKYSGNTGRHKDLREVLRTMNLDKGAWCIFTDVHDVLFQRPLPDLPTDVDAILCDEGKKFGEIEFWRELMPINMWGLESYNSGVWAMKTETLFAYWDYLYEQWGKFFDWYKNQSLPKIVDGASFPFRVPPLEKYVKEYIARVFNSSHDTIGFIDFLDKNKVSFKVIPELFACYAFQYEMGKIIQRGGRTLTQDGKSIAIVHYNGDMKKHLRKPTKENI